MKVIISVFFNLLHMKLFRPFYTTKKFNGFIIKYKTERVFYHQDNRLNVLVSCINPSPSYLHSLNTLNMQKGSINRILLWSMRCISLFCIFQSGQPTPHFFFIKLEFRIIYASCSWRWKNEICLCVMIQNVGF